MRTHPKVTEKVTLSDTSIVTINCYFMGVGGSV